MLKHLSFFKWACFLALMIIGGNLEAQQVFFNEIHYDNEGTDSNEAIEIAGPAGTDLTGWSVHLYNGSNGAEYHVVSLSGILSNQSGGFGFYVINYPVNGIQNGSPDGVALVNPANEVVQFLSYEGTFTATDGPAAGKLSVDIGVEEGGTTPIGFSLQLAGSGSDYADFSWQSEATNTFAAVNNGQQFLGDDPTPEPEPDTVSAIVFINEIHYDNDGVDENEGVELAGNAGVDLSGWKLIGYNGANGLAYSTTNLSGVLPNQQNGYGTIFFPIVGLQNGAPDGIALVNAADSIIQFLSYEGSFVAVGGPADGMESTDIGVDETSSTPLNFSLQLTGTGFSYQDFIWSGPIASTYSAVNTGQAFGDGGTDPDPDPEPEPTAGTIAEARTLPNGTEVVVSGTLTVANELGGPAFIQDQTGGIAVFDTDVHGEGLFEIGDSLKISAAIGFFNQQVQLVNVTAVENLGKANNPITPKIITVNEASGFEGSLVTIEDVFFDNNKGLLFPESNYQLTNAAGNIIELRIDGDVNSLVGREIPDSTVDITGVLGSFRGMIQLLPRFIDDLPETTPYVPEGSDIPLTSTLDVMTWNMEFFGATQQNFGPANVQLQLENARKILDSIQADVIAVQEVSDENLLQQLVAMLPGYESVCSDRYSYSFDGPDPNFPPQKLCFIYNTNVISIENERVIFEEMYDEARAGATSPLDGYPTGNPSSFWSSGRLPYMITITATVDGLSQTIKLINIHAKSGASASDIDRKTFDVKALKDTLDQYYPNDHVILLGDYNDDVDESIGGGVSPYEPFVTDQSYDVVTSTLSEESLRSFIFNDNVIDHIAISNELFESYVEGSETLFIPFNFIDNYANTTSDHLPVIVRLLLTEPLTADAGTDAVVYNGYEPKACTFLKASASGGTPPYTFDWSNGDTGDEIEVCPTAPTSYVVTVTDAAGRSTTDEVDVCAIQVSCGKGSSKKVKLCFNPSCIPGRGKTVCVSKYAVEALLARGATLGSCESSCEEDNDDEEEELPKFVLAGARVYPNPVKNDISIILEQPVSEEFEITIYNRFGFKISQQTISSMSGVITVDIVDLNMPRGINYIKIATSSETKILPIIKL